MSDRVTHGAAEDMAKDRHRVWARNGWESVHAEVAPGFAGMDPSEASSVDRLALPGGWLVRYRERDQPTSVVFVPEPSE